MPNISVYFTAFGVVTSVISTFLSSGFKRCQHPATSCMAPCSHALRLLSGTVNHSTQERSLGEDHDRHARTAARGEALRRCAPRGPAC